MEKYKILYGVIESRKRLTQKEIEKNSFEQYDDTTIFESDNREEAENTIKELAKQKYRSYDCYHKIHEYKRFELVQEVYEDEDEDPDYTTYKSLGIFYPNYEDEENDEEEEKEDE